MDKRLMSNGIHTQFKQPLQKIITNNKEWRTLQRGAWQIPL